MKRGLTVGLYVGFALAVFGIGRWVSLYEPPSHHHRTQEDYAEECQSEGCDGEEVRELEDTAYAVGPDRDEVDAELLRRAHVHGMLARRVGGADLLPP
jgi:hypothetical protein